MSCRLVLEKSCRQSEEHTVLRLTPTRDLSDVHCIFEAGCCGPNSMKGALILEVDTCLSTFMNEEKISQNIFLCICIFARIGLIFPSERSNFFPSKIGQKEGYCDIKNVMLISNLSKCFKKWLN